MKTIGLIAGNGFLPLLVAREARSSGLRVASCAIESEADGDLEKVSADTAWVKLGELGKVIRFFRKHGVREAVLAGKVRKVSLFGGSIRPDLEMVQALAGIRDWKDDSLIRAVVDHLGKKGIAILDSTAFLKESLLAAGTLSRRRPSKKEEADIAFGWQLAKELGRLDIGQTVVVKARACLAVEAIEGTDEAIRRGGALAREGAVVVKVAKPAQDMRFDVPCVGLSTLEAMRDARAAVLAVEARKTIGLDKKAMAGFADRHGLAIVVREG